MTTLDLAVIDVAAVRGGVLHRSDLDRLGATAHQRSRLTRIGLLRRVTPAVFVVRGYPNDWHTRLLAAVAQAGPEAVASHATAAYLWGFPRIGRGAIEVTVPRWVPIPRRTIGRVHHSSLPPLVRAAPDLPVSVAAPARTLLDLGARLRTGHLVECLQDLCRRGLVTVDGLAEEADDWRKKGRHGARRVDELLTVARAVPSGDSWLEGLFLRLIIGAGLPAPEVQAVIKADGATYRVDALWMPWRLVVEVNGHATHATRARLSADAERTARLQAAGFEVLTFTYDQVVDQQRFVVAHVGRRLAMPPSPFWLARCTGGGVDVDRFGRRLA